MKRMAKVKVPECVYCGEQYIPQSHTQKTCGEKKCQQRATRERVRHWREKQRKAATA